MLDTQIFGLERLEDRTLLAVNVTQNGAKLTITGDDHDNGVGIFDDSGGIRVRVDVDADGTPEIDEIYYGVENIKITLKGGDDEVFVRGITIEQSITIDTGTGNDLVFFDYSADFNEIDGNVSITTGDGDDEVAFAGAEVTGNLTITTGNGEDDVSIGDYEYVYSDVYGGASFADGYVEIRGNTVINTGNHDDYVEIQPDDGDEQVKFGGNLKISTGAGADEIDFGGDATYQDLYVHGNAQFDLGAGDDHFDIDNEEDNYVTFYGKVIINGGAGYDDVSDAFEWFDNASEVFGGGIGAIKFVKIEAFDI